MRAAWALLAVVLGACATLEASFIDKPEFELAGRIAARYGRDSFTGNLAWRHARGGDELLISSPLGAGVARIVRQGEAVTLSTAEPREYRAASAEALTEQVLGFRLPLAGLAEWVRGRPSTESPASGEYSPDGRLLLLEQSGWRIEFLDYQGRLPSRLRLLYPGLELRLAISEWK